MVANIITKPITVPGVRGMNRQESGGVLGPDWASDAKNCVIDKTGRLTSRKGWTTVSDAIAGSPDVKSVYEYLDASAVSRFVSGTVSKLYEGTSGALTDVSGAVVITDGRWKFQNFNGKVIGWQAGHTPIVKTGAGNFAAIVASSGAVPTGDDVLAAYGRVWAFSSDGLTLYWSNLLDETAWAAGTSGSLDLRSVWTQGMDYGVALAAFNGFLLIFGKDNILVYNNPTTPGSMTLVEVIRGVGCIARDSVQNIGEDVWFLSKKGIHSLNRVIQNESMPMVDISRNVRDWLLDYVALETMTNVRSVFSPVDGFYLLTMPASSITLCLDTRTIMEDGSARATYWSLVPKSMYLGQDKILYFGMTGYIGKYANYQDNGSSYRYIYMSPWIEMDPEQPVVNILKQIVSIMALSSSQTITFKWAFDFNDAFFTYQKSYAPDSGSEYGIGEYAEAEYGGSTSLRIAVIPTVGMGRLIRVAVETDVSGASVATQRLDLQAKQGRIA